MTKYEHDELGYGHRLDGIQAAILGAKLPHLDDWNAGRRDRASRYAELLADLPVITPEHLPNTEPVYHCYTIRLEDAFDRDAVVQVLKDNGVGVGVHYPIPLHLQPAYRFLELGEGDFPISEYMARRVLSLPIYAELTDEQQNYVVDVLRDALGA
jgi:dTDP-4-amino-4,6-dideoxygalactose transaminase